MLNFADKEELRNYFAPKCETGRQLPKINEVIDGTFYKLTHHDGTIKLYIAIDGKWFFISNLTEV